MTVRTNHTILRFANPFTVRNVDGVLPAGDYRVDQDEELIEGFTHLAYRRIGTFLHIPSISAPQTTTQIVPVSQTNLDAALMKDCQGTV